MAAAETARLIAELSLDVRKFTSGADKALGKLGKLGAKSTAIGTAVGVGMERLAEAGIRKLTGAVTGGLDSLASLENATSQVDGAIKQMGLTGKVTSGQVAEWANQIEANIGAAFDDKDITAATANLLRFGKLAPKNIKPAMQVMTDLAAKTGSVDSASSLLGKALADPAKAAGKLARVGVVLTKSQQDAIAAMVKAGDAAGAQKVLLDALAKTTKGAAAATQGPYQRSLSVLKDVVEDAQRALATGLLPVIMEVRDELSKELAKPKTLDNIKQFGQGLADGFREAVKWIKAVPWDQVGAAASGLLDFGKSIASAFMGMPTEAKELILGLTALNKLSGGAVINVGVDLLKGAGGTLFQQFLGKGSAANPMFVVPVGGGLGGPGGGTNVVGGGGNILGALGIAGVLISAAIPIGEGLRQGLGITFGSQSQEAHARAMQSMGRSTTDPAQLKALNDIDDRTGQVRDRIADVLEATRKNLQPLPENITRKQKQHFDTLRDKIEGSRIATVNRLDQVKAVEAAVRDRAEATRIATVTKGDGIIAAIRSLQLQTQINIRLNGTNVRTYQSATFLNRAKRLEDAGVT